MYILPLKSFSKTELCQHTITQDNKIRVYWATVPDPGPGPGPRSVKEISVRESALDDLRVLEGFLVEGSLSLSSDDVVLGFLRCEVLVVGGLLLSSSSMEWRLDLLEDSEEWCRRVGLLDPSLELEPSRVGELFSEERCLDLRVWPRFPSPLLLLLSLLLPLSACMHA